jgi:hypothetical protein
MPRARGVSLVVLLLASLGATGCGYSLAGRGSFLPDYIRSIGVPLFVNNTSVFDVEQRLTEQVRSELIGRGRYTVVPDHTGVDGLLLGEIQSITLNVAAFDQQQQATRYAVTLVVKVEFRDVKTDKVLWSNAAWQFTEQFDVTSATSGLDASAYLAQNQDALQRVSAEFARALVSAILEAF